jgi:hypothetical protein
VVARAMGRAHFRAHGVGNGVANLQGAVHARDVGGDVGGLERKSLVLDHNPAATIAPSDKPRRRLGHLHRYLTSGRTWLVLGVALGAIFLVISLLRGDGGAVASSEIPEQHPSAVHHLPVFITPPGATDVLLVIMALVLIAAIFGIGVFFFWLHSLPERLVHNSTKVHFDVVAVLALLSLFTHIHLFWVAALLLALIRIPDFSMPDFSAFLSRIASSLERIAAKGSRER